MTYGCTQEYEYGNLVVKIYPITEAEIDEIVSFWGIFTRKRILNRITNQTQFEDETNPPEEKP